MSPLFITHLFSGLFILFDHPCLNLSIAGEPVSVPIVDVDRSTIPRIIFVFQAASRGSLKAQDTYGVLLASLLVLVILFQQFLTTPGKGVNRELLYGLWGYILGWLLVLIGGVVNFVERRGVNRPQ